MLESPAQSVASVDEEQSEESDRFALERQVARELAEAKATSRRSSNTESQGTEHTKQYQRQARETSRSITRASISAVKSDASSPEVEHSTRTISRDRPDREIRANIRTYGRNKEQHRSRGRLGSEHGLPSKAPSNDSISMKSDDAPSIIGVRTSGRRVRPTARVAGLATPKTTSEIDCVSLQSLPDSNSTTSSELTTNSVDLQISKDGIDTVLQVDTSGSNEAQKEMMNDIGSQLQSLRSERKGLRKRSSPVIVSVEILEPNNDQDPVEDRSTTPHSAINEQDLGMTVDEAVSEHSVGQDEHRSTVPDEPSPEPQSRRQSISSMSSDLSDLSTISSVRSSCSHRSTSSTGSNTIQRLSLTSPATDPVSRQLLISEALALANKWRRKWRDMEKRVKLNLRKQERSKAAKESTVSHRKRKK